MTFRTVEQFPAKATQLTDLEVKRWLDNFRSSYNQLQNLLLPNSSDSGYVVHTSSDQVAYRSITGTSGEIDVANSDGVSGNTVISLATPIQFSAISAEIGSTGIYQLIGGNIYANSTSIACSSASETTLMSYQFPENFFDSDGIIIEYYAAGSYTSNANNKTVQLYFNDASQYSTGAVAVNTSGNNWSINGQIIRRSSTNAYVHGRGVYSFSSPSDTAFVADVSCDFTQPINFYFTGTGGVDNDVTQDIFILKYYAAAS